MRSLRSPLALLLTFSPLISNVVATNPLDPGLTNNNPPAPPAPNGGPPPASSGLGPATATLGPNGGSLSATTGPNGGPSPSMDCKSFLKDADNKDPFNAMSDAIEKSISTCKPFCGDLTNKSVSCMPKDQSGNGQIITDPGPQPNQWQLGSCKCDIPIASFVFNQVAIALPAIASIGCEILMQALNSVLEVGALAIPGGGEALDAADAGTQAAVKAAKAIDDAGQGSAAFASWLDPCPHSQFTNQIDDIFFPLIGKPKPKPKPKDPAPAPAPKNGPNNGAPNNGAPNNGAPNNGAPNNGAPNNGAPNSGAPNNGAPNNGAPNNGAPNNGAPNNGAPNNGKPGDKPTNAAPQKTDPPQKSDAPSASRDPSSAPPSSTSDAAACGLAKRDPVGTGTWANCSPGGTMHSTIITSVSFGNNAVTSTVACPKEYAQACLHYASAASVATAKGKNWLTFTCKPHQGTSTVKRVNGAATRTWSAQHSGAGWQDDSYRKEKSCERDEWPAAYFYPSKAEMDADKQAIRWVDQYSNGRAGNLWSGFCYNQALKDIKESDPGVKNPKNPSVKVEENNRRKPDANGKKPSGPVTRITYEAKDVPVFVLQPAADLPKGNDWGLSTNPCLPAPLQPGKAPPGKEDVGFTLLTDDAFYRGKAPPYDYKQPMPGSLSSIKAKRELGLGENDEESYLMARNATFFA